MQFVPAEYPENEKAAGRAASVVLGLEISELGAVTGVVVLESAGADFDRAAVAAARQFVFRPAELDGQPAPVRITYRYQFALELEPAEERAALSGLVRERTTQTPLAGVVIELGSDRRTVTTEDGRFVFDELEPGLYPLRFTRGELPGLQTEEELVAGQRLEAVYELELPGDTPEAGAPGDDLEIVVSAPRVTRQVVSTEVSADQARVVAGTQGDVLKIVESLPGVARSTPGSGQLVVWGAAPEETRVYVDGVPIPLLYHFGGIRSVVHTELVRSVELVPGGYGAAYGRGLGGIVVVRTEDESADGMHGTVDLNLLDASASAEAPLGDDADVFVAGRRGHLAPLLDWTTSADVDEFFPIPDYYDAQARLRRRFSADETLSLWGLHSFDEVSRQVGSVDPEDRKSETRTLRFSRVSVRYQNGTAEGGEVEVVPWFGHDRARLRAAFGRVPTELESSTTTYGLRASYRGRLTTRVMASVGLDVEVARSKLERAGSVGSPAREGDARVFGQPPADEINADTWSAVVGSAAPYAEAEIALFSDRVHVVPGLRFDPTFTSVDRRIPAAGDAPGIGAYSADFALEPRLSVRYSPSSRATFSAAYGRYRQPPPADDLSPVFGNPLLGGSRAEHLLGGVSVRPLPAISLETTAFYTRSTDRIVRNPVPSPLVAQALVAAGEGRSFGTQLLLRRDPEDGVFGWIAYTLSRSERRDAESGELRLFDYDQTHVLTALAGLELGGGLELGARFRAATGYPRTPVTGVFYDSKSDRFEPVLGTKNGERIPAFMQLDLRIARRFELEPAKLELYLDVQNVTCRENYEEIAYASDYSQRRYIVGLPLLPVFGARLEL